MPGNSKTLSIKLDVMDTAAIAKLQRLEMSIKKIATSLGALQTNLAGAGSKVSKIKSSHQAGSSPAVGSKGGTGAGFIDTRKANSMLGTLAKNTEALSKINQKHSRELIGLSKSTRRANDALKSVPKSVAQIKTATTGGGSGGAGGGTPPGGGRGGFIGSTAGGDRAGGFGTRIKSVAEYAVASRVVMGTFEGLRSGFDTIVEVDKELAELNKVLATSTSMLDSLKKSAISTGKEFGNSVGEVLRGYRVFAQQGLPAEQVKERGRIVSLATNVSTLNAEGAAETITAGLKVYGKDVNNSAERLIDSFVAVESQNAVTAGDLSEVVKRVGAAAENAGISFDQLNAMTTVIQESTRAGGSRISRTIRFLTKNIFSTAAPTLKSVGVDIAGVGGDLKDAPEILADLAKVFPTLTKRQQRNVAVSTAGTRFVSEFLALMKNYSKVSVVAAQSQDAQGTAQERNAKIMQSLSKQASKTSTAFQGLALSVGAGLVKPLTTALRLAEKFASVLTEIGEFKIPVLDVTVGETAGTALTGTGSALLATYLGSKVLGGGAAAGGAAGGAAAGGGIAGAAGAAGAAATGVVSKLFSGAGKLVGADKLTKFFTGVAAKGGPFMKFLTGAGLILSRFIAPLAVITLGFAALSKILGRLTETSEERSQRTGVNAEIKSSKDLTSSIGEFRDKIKTIDERGALIKDRFTGKDSLERQRKAKEAGDISITEEDLSKQRKEAVKDFRSSIIKTVSGKEGLKIDGLKISDRNKVTFEGVEISTEAAESEEGMEAINKVATTLAKQTRLRTTTAVLGKQFDKFSEKIDSSDELKLLNDTTRKLSAKGFFTGQVDRKGTLNDLDAFDRTNLLDDEKRSKLQRTAFSSQANAAIGGLGTKGGFDAIVNEYVQKSFKLGGSGGGSSRSQLGVLLAKDLISENQDIADAASKAIAGEGLVGKKQRGELQAKGVISYAAGLNDIARDLEGRDSLEDTFGNLKDKLSVNDIIRFKGVEGRIQGEGDDRTFISRDTTAKSEKERLASVKTISLDELEKQLVGTKVSLTKVASAAEKLFSSFNNLATTGFGAGQAILGKDFKSGANSLLDFSDQLAGTFLKRTGDGGRDGTPKFNKGLRQFLTTAESERVRLRKEILDTSKDSVEIVDRGRDVGKKEASRQIEAVGLIAKAAEMFGSAVKSFESASQKLLKGRFDRQAKERAPISPREAKLFSGLEGSQARQLKIGKTLEQLGAGERAQIAAPNLFNAQANAQEAQGLIQGIKKNILGGMQNLGEIVSGAGIDTIKSIDIDTLDKILTGTKEGFGGEVGKESSKQAEDLKKIFNDLTSVEKGPQTPEQEKKLRTELFTKLTARFSELDTTVDSAANALTKILTINEPATATAQALSAVIVSAEKAQRAFEDMSTLPQFKGIEEALGKSPFSNLGPNAETFFRKGARGGPLQEIRSGEGKDKFEFQKSMARLLSSEGVQSGRVEIFDKNRNRVQAISAKERDERIQGINIEARKAGQSQTIEKSRGLLSSKFQQLLSTRGSLQNIIKTAGLSGKTNASLQGLISSLDSLANKPQESFINRRGQFKGGSFTALDNIPKQLQSIIGVTSRDAKGKIQALKLDSSSLSALASLMGKEAVAKLVGERFKQDPSTVSSKNLESMIESGQIDKETGQSEQDKRNEAKSKPVVEALKPQTTLLSQILKAIIGKEGSNPVSNVVNAVKDLYSNSEPSKQQAQSSSIQARRKFLEAQAKSQAEAQIKQQQAQAMNSSRGITSVNPTYIMDGNKLNESLSQNTVQPRGLETPLTGTFPANVEAKKRTNLLDRASSEKSALNDSLYTYTDKDGNKLATPEFRTKGPQSLYSTEDPQYNDEQRLNKLKAFTNSTRKLEQSKEVVKKPMEENKNTLNEIKKATENSSNVADLAAKERAAQGTDKKLEIDTDAISSAITGAFTDSGETLKTTLEKSQLVAKLDASFQQQLVAAIKEGLSANQGNNGTNGVGGKGANTADITAAYLDVENRYEEMSAKLDKINKDAGLNKAEFMNELVKTDEKIDRQVTNRELEKNSLNEDLVKLNQLDTNTISLAQGLVALYSQVNTLEAEVKGLQGAVTQVGNT